MIQQTDQPTNIKHFCVTKTATDRQTYETETEREIHTCMYACMHARTHTSSTSYIKNNSKDSARDRGWGEAGGNLNPTLNPTDAARTRQSLRRTMAHCWTCSVAMSASCSRFCSWDILIESWTYNSVITFSVAVELPMRNHPGGKPSPPLNLRPHFLRHYSSYFHVDEPLTKKKLSFK